MGDDKESRLGLYASVFAAIMVVALSIMAFLALDRAPMQTADSHPAVTEQQPSKNVSGTNG